MNILDLRLAIRTGNNCLLNEFLSKGSFDPNMEIQGLTLLMHAAQTNQTKMIRKLVEVGANVNQEIFNPYNDAARLSFDDWFEMRMFSSYIVKESNVWDDDIKYYEENQDNPFASLLKSEAIKNDLFIFEHDLWEY